MKTMEIQAYVVYNPHSDKGRPMSIGGQHYSVNGPWRLTLRADLVKAFGTMPNETHESATYVIQDGDGPDYLVVEDVEHFNWRLRFVLDNDQLVRHEFLMESPVTHTVAHCLICNETNQNSFVHSKVREISAYS